MLSKLNQTTAIIITAVTASKSKSSSPIKSTYSIFKSPNLVLHKLSLSVICDLIKLPLSSLADEKSNIFSKSMFKVPNCDPYISLTIQDHSCLIIYIFWPLQTFLAQTHHIKNLD